jgi:hypothetical protein
MARRHRGGDDLRGQHRRPVLRLTVDRPVLLRLEIGHRHGGAGRLDDGDDDLRLDRLAGELLLDLGLDVLVVAGAGGVRAAVSETFVRLSRGGTTATVPLTAVAWASVMPSAENGISDCAPSAPTARKVWGSRTRVRVFSTKGDRLLDVVAGAGGVRAAVSETFVRLSRGGTTGPRPRTGSRIARRAHPPPGRSGDRAPG